MRTIEDVSPRRTDALKHTFITGIVRFIRFRSLSWSAPSNDGASWYDSVTKYPEENEERRRQPLSKIARGDEIRRCVQEKERDEAQAGQ
jgi:hypothetical protein